MLFTDCTVFLIEKNIIVIFQVVSLLKYDNADKGVKVNPSPGYPVVCITVSFFYSLFVYLDQSMRIWRLSHMGEVAEADPEGFARTPSF